jgi:hypothetical protein
MIRADEHAERVVVDRGDPAEVHDDRASRRVDQVGQRFPNPRRARGVEVAGQLEHGAALDGPDLQRQHRRTVRDGSLVRPQTDPISPYQLAAWNPTCPLWPPPEASWPGAQERVTLVEHAGK